MQKLKQRLQKNRDKLFTFLRYDNVPWHNNNAEHAVKAYARLRSMFTGQATPKAISEYLILLSLCQTCKYMNLDFLGFLRSGERDIYAYAASHPKPAWKKYAPVKRKRYDEAFKRSAVARWLESGKTAIAIAAELGIKHWNLKYWRKVFYGRGLRKEEFKTVEAAADGQCEIPPPPAATKESP